MRNQRTQAQMKAAAERHARRYDPRKLDGWRTVKLTPKAKDQTRVQFLFEMEKENEK